MMHIMSYSVGVYYSFLYKQSAIINGILWFISIASIIRFDVCQHGWMAYIEQDPRNLKRHLGHTVLSLLSL